MSTMELVAATLQVTAGGLGVAAAGIRLAVTAMEARRSSTDRKVRHEMRPSKITRDVEPTAARPTRRTAQQSASISRRATVRRVQQTRKHRRTWSR
jgi:hypothetical protein